MSRLLGGIGVVELPEAPLHASLIRYVLSSKGAWTLLALTLRCASLAFLFSAVAFGQAAERPRFDVASIKMYPSGSVVPAGYGGFDRSPDGSITSKYMTLRMYLQWAYSIEGEVSGPTWIDDERYDIAAKTSEPSSAEQVKLMMQSLLEERFGLTLHRVTKTLPVAVLVVGKAGTKNLHAVQGSGSFSLQRTAGILRVKNAPMSRIAGVLGSPLGNMPLEKVLDQTKLNGLFDITLDLNGFDPKDPVFGGSYREMRSALLVFVSGALQKQYGLRLERRNVPLESLVVDRGNKVPTEN